MEPYKSPSYKLINPIVPGKINVAINNKFAKLTLSSNKKKPNEQIPIDEANMEKRKSASRNLLGSFSQSVVEADVPENPLFQSEIDSQKIEDSIIISSSSGTDCSNSAITVSDSLSDVNDSHEINSFDFELMTSDIPQSGDTANAFLPNTFSNDNADRMEAFLRDVSLQQREMKNNAEYQWDEPKDTSLISSIVNMAEADTVSINSHEIVGSENSITSNKSASGDNTKHFAFKTNKSLKNSFDNVVDVDNHTNFDCNDGDHIADADTVSINSNDIMESEILKTSNKGALRENPLIVTESTSENTFDNVVDGDNGMKVACNDDTVPNTTGFSNGNLNIDEDEMSLETSSQNLSQATPVKSTGTFREDSVIISETSCESIGESLPNSPNHSSSTTGTHSSTPAHSKESIIKDIVISEAIDKSDSDDSSMHQMQMSMANINISAKININIQISDTRLSSEEEISNHSQQNDENNFENIPSSNDLKESPEIVEQKVVNYVQKKKHADIENLKEHHTPNRNMTEGENFVSYAEKLLNQLYGKQWKTPDVVSKLEHKNTNLSCSINKVNRDSSHDANKKMNRASKIETGKINSEKTENEVEESLLGDFSLFRENIAKTNLDSTRLKKPRTPKNKIQNKDQRNIGAFSAPRLNNRTPKQVNVKTPAADKVFKIPQTEYRKPPLKTKSGRTVKERWRKIYDEDMNSDSENASDDEDADFTINSSLSSSDNSCFNEDLINRPKKKTFLKKQAKASGRKENSEGEIIYLDLSQDEVTILEGPPKDFDDDENFQKRLQNILLTCKHENKPKLEATPRSTNTKRKLFTANFGEECESVAQLENTDTADKNCFSTPKTTDELLVNSENVNPNVPSSNKQFNLINKQLEQVKISQPVFKITPTKKDTNLNLIEDNCTPKARTPKHVNITPRSGKRNETKGSVPNAICNTPDFKYGFLKSLDVSVGLSFCHPDALQYRTSYRQKKEELSEVLYKLYNEKIFGNKLDVPLMWNKKLKCTAGRCLFKKRLSIRTSVVELSEKVLTSADRLRCTLIHELCHAATWVFTGEGGHGNAWKEWARRANTVFPELPKIAVCHQYEIEYKYTYQCTLCGAKSHAHSKSKKVENIRCSYCHGAIEIFLNKKDKEGNIIPTPVREPTGFAKFVKENYKIHKRSDRNHADVMKILSTEFSSLKVNNAI